MESKKKILYVITQGAWGGAQRYIFDLVTNLSSDFEIILAVGEVDGSCDLQDKILKYQNIKILQLKYLVRRFSPFHDLLAIFELAKFYRQIKPDVVHLNSSKAGVIGSLAKVINNFPPKADQPRAETIIYTVHGWVFTELLSKIIKAIYFWAEKITARWKNKIIVLSEEEKKIAISDLGLKAEKLALIPLGVDSLNFLDKADAKDFLEKKIGYKFEDVKIVGTIANLFRTKGLDILIEAVNQIKEKRKDKTKFIIIGTGPEKNNLASLIKKYNLENEIILAGSIPDAWEYLHGFDLFVLPSRKEGLPYTLLEAIQAKIPVIATAVGGVPSLIKDKINGLLVEPEDPTALAHALEYAFDHPEEMKNMAGHFLERYGLTEMLQSTVELYGCHSE